MGLGMVLAIGMARKMALVDGMEDGGRSDARGNVGWLCSLAVSHIPAVYLLSLLLFLFLSLLLFVFHIRDAFLNEPIELTIRQLQVSERQPET